MSPLTGAAGTVVTSKTFVINDTATNGVISRKTKKLINYVNPGIQGYSKHIPLLQ